jgi:hypothetical protein
MFLVFVIFLCVENAERCWFTLSELKTSLKDGRLLGSEPIDLASLLCNNGEQF